jgi:hypothetical protein
MTKTFTQNDLIRFIYHETSEAEERALNKALICDSELQGQYKELVAVKSQLDKSQLEPSALAVQNILGYARSLQEKH